MPAVMALFVSMAFTIAAGCDESLGSKLAIPVASIAGVLLLWQVARENQSDA